MKFILILILVVFVGVLLYFTFQAKKVKVGNVFLVTGGVKVGKSALSLYLVNSLHTYACMGYLLSLPFKLLKGKYDFSLVPAIVSNIPLAKIPHIPLDLEIIERKKNVPWKSILFLDEASLVADQYSFKNGNKVDDELNERITLFVKLFGHMTHGGYCVLNTQCISDLHYGFKRNISNYIWIHSKTKLPFFMFFRLKEMQYSDDNSTVNVVEGDVADNLKWFLIPKNIFKKYDCYCYSVLTDNNPMLKENIIIKKRSQLKTTNVISFRKFKTINREV